ncbi:hypothetical protein COEREDRAFT_82371 [Coemansia reversa NRRL 1564]|uniref:Uncharacterized protein n=1 Tax=Coemansia reversa (strain ATCC 12441 / NRRL 1564) TaxID=763665 RepID=A0A2G5B7J1_COERN|nr:hypothetical protein COEREDRAFT_82371 [Coemansia reversa NRRL 1564]|eukprot:PIA14952.1 hypothetical protein COEREDRAFT_82371 [Coemansia reversa NRRL 1564]
MMRTIAVSAAFIAAVVAQNEHASIPSQTLNQAQQEALDTLSAAQAELNAQNSQMIANDKASQQAAILSQSNIANESELSDLDSLESNDSDSSDADSVDEDGDSGASSHSGSVLALALVVGAAMF